MTGKTDHNGGYASRVRKPETMYLETMSSRVKGAWKEEDQRYILNNHDKMFVEDIAEYLGRKVKSVRAKAAAMGCSIKSKPTKSEN